MSLQLGNKLGPHQTPTLPGSLGVYALDRTFSAAGRAAVVTTLLLLIGFPVLMLGSVKTVYYFGLLTTIAAAALYGDLIVLPLLLRWLGPRKTARRTWPERKDK